jgi:hypothetical protein
MGNVTIYTADNFSPFELYYGECKVFYESGAIKIHGFWNDKGFRHGEYRLYRENGEVASRELYINGYRRNAGLRDPEDRMLVALKYGVPLLD